MKKEMLLAGVRHLLTWLSGVLITRGIIDSSETEGLIAGGVGIAGLAWSLYRKWARDRVLNETATIPTQETKP